MTQAVRIAAALLTILMLNAARADDWPQWRGPERTGISSEKGLADSWPEGGPKEVFCVEDLGKGYATVAVVRGRIFTTGLEGNEGFLYCYDVTGKQLWKSSYGEEWKKSYPGSRSTPTVDGKTVYIMTGSGRAIAFSGRDGKKLWEVDTLKQFGGSNITWGVSESVLVDGDMLICTPGGKEAGVVALNKNDGKLLWKTAGLAEKSGYCSPTIIEHDGARILLTMLAKNAVGIDPKTGKLLWKHLHETSHDVHPNTPVYHNGTIFISGGYGSGSALLKLGKRGTSLEQVWKDNPIDVHHANMIGIDGYIYATGHNNGAFLKCVRMSDGKVMWEEKKIAKGAPTAVDGKLIHYSEKGDVFLLDAKPEGCTIRGQFRVRKGSGEHWAHPVVSDGVLYIRHGEALMAFSVK